MKSFFLLLRTIPLYEYIIVDLSIPKLRDFQAVSSFCEYK